MAPFPSSEGRDPDSGEQDERRCFERLRDGDVAAFDAIFRDYYARLVLVADRMLRDRAVAEEIAQDVLLELWRRREMMQVEDSPRAYLIRATRNRALNHLRHLRVEREGEPHVADPSAMAPAGDAQLLETELAAAVREAIEALPPRCREIFELSRVHGLRYAEIAGTLGISVKTVEAQMGNALRALRGRLAPWLPDARRPARPGDASARRSATDSTG